jgi:Family of unknown function (DUF6526)
MAEHVQTYKNHARFYPPYHFFVVPILALNALNEIRHVIQNPSVHSAWTLVVAIALATFALTTRFMILTVQDRVIRMEMRQRLAQCLPGDLQARIGDLTRQQLIALRFASDAELGDLVREVLAGKLASSKEIKLRVKNWQADWLRA